MMNSITNRLGRSGGRAAVAIVATLLTLAALLTAASPATAHSRVIEFEDVLGQGGDGVHAEDGAKLVRTTNKIKVKWRVRVPQPGSYEYPLPEQVPPGAPLHPPIEAGAPEVFTLWAFVFNAPELCNGPCDMDDIGDTPAQGGVYQLDSAIADCRRIRMNGKIRVGDQPVAGVALQSPRDAEVHVAMAPHGKARTGDELHQQLNSAVGTPAHWWPALFIDE